MKSPTQKSARLSKKTVAQLLFAEHLRELGFYGVEYEFRFTKERMFRFDIAIPQRRIGVEIDGGLYAGGHRRGADWEKQYEKGNLAQVFGWKIFTFSNAQVLDGRAKDFVRNWLVKGTLEVK